MTRAEILNQLYRKQSGWFPHVWTGNGSFRNIPVLQITAWVPLPLRNPPWLPVLTPWPAVTTPNGNCRFPNETVSIWVQGLSCLLPYPSYLSQCTIPALFTRHTEQWDKSVENVTGLTVHGTCGLGSSSSGASYCLCLIIDHPLDVDCHALLLMFIM